MLYMFIGDYHARYAFVAKANTSTCFPYVTESWSRYVQHREIRYATNSRSGYLGPDINSKSGTRRRTSWTPVGKCSASNP